MSMLLESQLRDGVETLEQAVRRAIGVAKGGFDTHMPNYRIELVVMLLEYGLALEEETVSSEAPESDPV